MNYRIAAAVLAAATVLASIPLGQTSEPQKSASPSDIAGGVVAVVKDGNVLLQKGFGNLRFA
jgi:hypothetical protein